MILSFRFMDSVLQKLFLEELRKQCIFALFAYSELTAKVYENDPYRVWLSLQSMLIASANISKILFADKNKTNKEEEYRRERRESLCKILEISGNEQFASRSARNDFEHFDERLEDWYRESTIHDNLIDGEIGGDNLLKENKDVHYLRFFNTDGFVFRFRDKEYEMEELRTDIIDLLNKINHILKKDI